ncbi:hypothetical protein I6H52_08930 [Corynebacterium urealyticum]|uniref:Uncharacterized protein n=1 Tax=Corynebacterium urealyticum (strain ATCC 43042 / DSM 7109) TaxID=504474 RepID=B1VFI7_CORU7|nr:hypothetical protein [Corynebacterium urealyticum]QQC41983.1 hypothetical protein I6H51_09980 [Corynebacterium urealyticum]QQE50607.1 hypothetical protein I6H52_08930 [Corynebacterium urealyticum]CAQ04526.1 hypothetical protein cu0566 [Corynebacterium urealyticum DSM 7109]SNV95966.1 Uncharacterised protein [Corynebacterium urealyticum]
MKARIIPAILAVPLLIAGCSSEEHNIADPLPITCYSHLPCEGELKIETITLGGSCDYGMKDYDPRTIKPGNSLLQIKGHFTLDTAENGWTMLDDPATINRDRDTEPPAQANVCDDADSGYEDWSSTLDEGHSMKVYGSWEVAENTDYVYLLGQKIKVEDIKPLGEELKSSTPRGLETPAPQPEAPAPQPEDVGPLNTEKFVPKGEVPMSTTGNIEHDATANFWKCIQAGGTEESCLQ